MRHEVLSGLDDSITLCLGSEAIFLIDVVDEEFVPERTNGQVARHREQGTRGNHPFNLVPMLIPMLAPMLAGRIMACRLVRSFGGIAEVGTKHRQMLAIGEGRVDGR